MPHSGPSSVHPLTKRELEILRWICEGKTYWETARIIGRRHGTVKKHLQRIYRKIGVENRMAAANSLREQLSRLPRSDVDDKEE